MIAAVAAFSTILCLGARAQTSIPDTRRGTVSGAASIPQQLLQQEIALEAAYLVGLYESQQRVVTPEAHAEMERRLNEYFTNGAAVTTIPPGSSYFTNGAAATAGITSVIPDYSFAPITPAFPESTSTAPSGEAGAPLTLLDAGTWDEPRPASDLEEAGATLPSAPSSTASMQTEYPPDQGPPESPTMNWETMNWEMAEPEPGTIGTTTSGATFVAGPQAARTASVTGSGAVNGYGAVKGTSAASLSTGAAGKATRIAGSSALAPVLGAIAGVVGVAVVLVLFRPRRRHARSGPS